MVRAREGLGLMILSEAAVLHEALTLTLTLAQTNPNPNLHEARDDHEG